jgi:hypothetical protein
MDRYTWEENTYDDIEEWGAQLISGEDDDLYEPKAKGWKRPSDTIKSDFESWKMDVYNNEKKFSKDVDPKLVFERLDKEIYEKFAELHKDIIKDDITDAYYRVAVLLGKIKYIKELNINWEEKKETSELAKHGAISTTEIPFLSILEPKGKLIFKQINDFYSGRDIKELVLMFCALRDHALIDPPIIQNLLSNQAGLNRIFSETFGNPQSDTAIRNQIANYIKNPGYQQSIDIKRHYNIIKGFLESLQEG